MATQQDLVEDLAVGLSEVDKTLKHYRMGDWKYYLVVRKPGVEGSWVVLKKSSDTSEFDQELERLHLDCCRREK